MDVAQLIETLKQKEQAKAQKIRRQGIRETQYSQIQMFKEDTKKIYRKLGLKNIEAREPPLWQKQRHTGSQYGEKKQSIMKEQNG